MKRKTPAGPGLHKDQWGLDTSDKQNNSIVTPLPTRIRHRIARWLAPDMTWNSDMSRELDCWIDAYESACIEIERLKSLVGASTHSEVRHD